jgi:hypothetical protein
MLRLTYWHWGLPLPIFLPSVCQLLNLLALEQSLVVALVKVTNA